MIEIIKTYEEEEGGIIYIVEELSNGGVAKTVKPDGTAPEPMPDPLSEEEERQMEMAMNIEYLIQLTEMNMEVE